MAQCLSPYITKKEEGGIPVPCGKCPTCAARRVSAWSYRLVQHEKDCDSALFVTLTYDTNHIPITNKGYASLSKRDLQKFFKRLRKRDIKGAGRIKYYAVGEYGTLSWRPHYHILLFNANYSDVEASWQKGHVHYGTVSAASVGYTLKYINKPKRVPQHRNDDRQPEFSLMSKKLGINYITPNTIKYHTDDLARMYVNTLDGKKVSMPRYYKDKIYNEVQRDKANALAKQKVLEKKQTATDEQREQAKLAAFRKQQNDANKADKL